MPIIYFAGGEVQILAKLFLDLECCAVGPGVEYERTAILIVIRGG
jgi:hypothetical protein